MPDWSQFDEAQAPVATDPAADGNKWAQFDAAQAQPSTWDKAKAIAAVVPATIAGAGVGLERGAGGLAHALHLLPDAWTGGIAADANESQAAIDKLTAASPTATTVAQFASGAVPFIVNPALGALGMAGNAAEDANEAGAGRLAQIGAGTVAGTTALVAPMAARAAVPALAPVVSRIAAPVVGDGLGAALGLGAERAAQGAVTGAGLNLGAAGATAVYDPNKALEQAQNIGTDASVMAALEGTLGTAGAVRPSLRDARASRLAEAKQVADAYDQAPREAPPLPREIPQDFKPDVANTEIAQAAEEQRAAMLEQAAKDQAAAAKAKEASAAVDEGLAQEQAARDEMAAPLRDLQAQEEAPAPSEQHLAVEAQARQAAEAERAAQQAQDAADKAARLHREAIETLNRYRAPDDLLPVPPEPPQRITIGAAKPVPRPEPYRDPTPADARQQAADRLAALDAEENPDAGPGRPAAADRPVGKAVLEPDLGAPAARLVADKSRGRTPAAPVDPAPAAGESERAGRPAEPATANPTGADPAAAPVAPAPPADATARSIADHDTIVQAERAKHRQQLKDLAAKPQTAEVLRETEQMRAAARAAMLARNKERQGIVDQALGRKAEQPPAEPAPAAADRVVPVRSIDDLHRGFRDVYGLDDDHATAATALVRARAASMGLTPDAFVAKHLREIRQGTGSPSLNQKGSELFQDHGAVRLDAPGESLAYDRLLKQWKRAHGDREPSQGSDAWQRLQERARAVDAAKGRPLYQDNLHDVNKGAISFAEDGRAVIHALKAPDVSTAVHELGHLFRRTLDANDQRLAGKWAGARDGKWGRAAEEKFARAFERYLRDGIAPVKPLQRVFDQLRTWMRTIYDSIKGTPLAQQITPEIKGVFDRMLTPAKGFESAVAPGELAKRPPAAPKAPAKSLPQESTQAAPLSAPGSDRTQKSRAAEPKAGGTPAGESITTRPAAAAAEPQKGELANYGTTEGARHKVEAMDQRRDAPPVEHRADVEAEAERRLSADYQGERGKILDKVRAGTVLDSHEVAMAKAIADREVQDSFRTGADLASLQEFHLAYRESGTAAARALGIRYDKTLSKAQRVKGMLTDALITPGTKFLRGIDDAKAALAKAKEAGDAAGAGRAKARLEAVKKSALADLVRIRKALLKEGVDVLYQGEDAIRAAHIVDQVMAKKGTWGGVFREWFVNAILSGIRTVTTNVVGSPLNAAREMGINRGVESLLNLVGGSHEAASVGEARHMLAGILPGFQKAVVDGFKTLWHERSVFRGELSNPTELEEHPVNIGGKWGRAVRLPTTVARAADQFWKTWIAHVDVGAQAHRLGKQAGLSGDELSARIREHLDDPESPAWEAAMATADHVTFNSKAGALTQKVLGLRDFAIPGTDIRPLFYQLPFVRTPANLLKQSFKMTPAYLPIAIAKAVRAGASKTGYRYDNWRSEAAEQLVGFAGTLAVVHMATGQDDDGLPLMTGSMERVDKGTKAALKRSGVEPFSVRLFGQRYSYRNIEPFATAMGMAADLAHDWQHLEQGGSAGEFFGAVKDAVIGQVKAKSMLKSVGDLAQAMSSGQTGDAAAQQWLQSFATSWVPNIIEASQRDFDPVVRDQRAQGQGVDFWKEYGYSMAAQAFAPWAQTKAVSIWGQPVTKDQPGPGTDTLWNIVRAVNPATAQVARAPEDLDRLILNWNNDSANKPFVAGPPRRDYMDGGAKRFLSKADYERFQVRAGELAVASLKDAEMDPAHPTAGDIKTIKRALFYARRAARAEVLGKGDGSDDGETADDAADE